jgi:hypothetical protein
LIGFLRTLRSKIVLPSSESVFFGAGFSFWFSCPGAAVQAGNGALYDAPAPPPQMSVL